MNRSHERSGRLRCGQQGGGASSENAAKGERGLGRAGGDRGNGGDERKNGGRPMSERAAEHKDESPEAAAGSRMQFDSWGTHQMVMKAVNSIIMESVGL